MLLSLKEIISVIGAETHSAIPLENIPSEKILTDTRKDLSNALFVAIKGEKFDGHDFLDEAKNSGAVAAIVEKNKIKKTEPQILPFLIVSDTLSAYQKIAALNRIKSNAKIIALTGSCGKTSTKDMLSAIFASAAGDDKFIATAGNTNNHVGVPMNLLRINENHQFAIIEMGTNHPGEIETLTCCAKPDLAIITSIGRAHIEFLGSLKGVAIEKSSIFRGLKKDGIAVIPAECEFRKILEDEAKNAGAKIFSFATGDNSNADLCAKCLKTLPDSSEVEFSFANFAEKYRFTLPVPGAHQVSNAAAAALAAFAIGIRPEKICAALGKIALSGMRMRKKIINSVTFINDAYNANPESAKAGIEHIAQTIKNENLILILGDMLELGSISEQAHYEVLRFAVEKIPSALIITVGERMKNAAKELRNSQIISIGNSAEAAKFAKSFIEPGATVYLKASRGVALEKIEEAFENKNF